MEIRVLRYFLAVAREESITRAAEILHITQPTLSRQLSQLEKQMGVKLLIRGTRKITLTNEGILLRRRAEEILELVDKTERELAEQEEQVEGVVAIGCGDLRAVQRLPELICSFHAKYPHVTFLGSDQTDIPPVKAGTYRDLRSYVEAAATVWNCSGEVY